MSIWTIIGIICVVYGILLLLAGLFKVKFMVKLVKIKFGKNVSDKKAVNIMYICGLILLAAGILLWALL